MMEISGFLVLKNAVKQGYPFIETITAALPICDEFLISDGQSTDGTWDVLERIKAAYPNKIKLYNESWETGSQMSEVIAQVTNRLKQHCQGQYCLNIQANEIIHEQTAEEIRRLPKLYPDVEMFFLPFYNILGNNYLFQIDYRRRLVKNLPHIISRGDAASMGYDSNRLITNPLGLLRYLLRRTGEKTIYLTKPVYRYYSLFPVNYVEKIKARYELWGDQEYQKTIKRLQAMSKRVSQKCNEDNSSSADFWKEFLLEYFSQWHNDPVIRANSANEVIKLIDDEPLIIKPLLNKWHYDVAKSLELLPKDKSI